MKGLILSCAALLQLCSCYGYPANSGVAAVSYQDPQGNRSRRQFMPPGWFGGLMPGQGPNWRLEPGNYPGDFGFGPNFNMFGGGNSAYAGAFATPGFSQQVASINPGNPQMPNINVVNRFSDSADASGKPQFMSVSSSSYASSSNLNGKQEDHRGAETVVNNNGKVTAYKVKN